MKRLLPGATLGVMGGGQLGRMFVHAAQRMDRGLAHAVGLGERARGEERRVAQSFLTTRIKVGSCAMGSASKPRARTNLSMS